MNSMTQGIEHPDKKFQLMMGLKYLSALNANPLPIQTYSMPIPQVPAYHLQPQIVYCYPIQAQIPSIIPVDAQYEQQKLISQLTLQSLHNTLMSCQIEERTTKTSDSFYPNCVANKICTSQSFQDSNDQKFLKKKTVRNTIVIEEEDEESKKIPKQSSYFKHHSAPIKLVSRKVFQTHLSKPPIEQDPLEHIYKCNHDGCDLSYKTKKQKVSHHGKMDQECQKDTTSILKMISRGKKIIKRLIQQEKLNKNNQSLIQKYEKIMKHISIKEYVQMICGLKYDQ